MANRGYEELEEGWVEVDENEADLRLLVGRAALLERMLGAGKRVSRRGVRSDCELIISGQYIDDTGNAILGIQAVLRPS